MKPAKFHYHRPASKAEALELKRDLDLDGSFLAGGQSLMPMLNMRLAQPEALIDLNRVEELAGIERRGAATTIGAMTRHAAVEGHEGLARDCPLMREAVGHVGHAVIRNRGTIGGSVAHADVAAEIPVALVALQGTVTAEGPLGAREIAAGDFFEFHFTTALDSTELVTGVTVPDLDPEAGHAFLEVSRRHGDFAVAAVAAVLDGPRLRLCFGGISARPVVVETEEDDPAADAVAAADEAGIASDLTADRDYRRRLVAVLARRARAVALDRSRSRRSDDA